MPSLTQLLQSTASSIASQVGSAVTSVLGFIVNGVNNDIIKPATSGIDQTLSLVAQGVDALQSEATKGIESTIQGVGNSIGQVVNTVESGFTSAIGNVESGLASIGGTIANVFNEIVSGISQGFSAVTGAVGAALSALGRDIESGIAEFAGGVTAVFKPILDSFITFIEGLPADIETIAEDIGAGVKVVADKVESIANLAEKEILKYTPKDLQAIVKDFVLGDYVDGFKIFVPDLIKLMEEGTGIKFTGDLGVSMARITALGGAEYAIGITEEFFPGAAFIMARLLNHIADSIAVSDFRALQQAGNMGTPNEVLPLGELVKGKYRGLFSDDVYYREASKHGMAQENADVLYKNAVQLIGLNELVALYKRGVFQSDSAFYAAAERVQVPKDQADLALALYNQLIGIGEAVQMWRRGVLPEGWQSQFDDAIRSGFTQERIDALKAISYNLPNFQQLKEFKLRGVDDDAVAQKFKLDTGLDDAFYAEARKEGWSDANIKRLYRATWQFPPFFILHNLYAAGKLSQDDFRSLMQAQGFAPYFIDSFAESLAPALTQGDIKEMYKYQVIEASDIVPELSKIGVPNDLAQKLSTLWVASVKQAPPIEQTQGQVDAAAMKGETKQLIVEAYKDGLLKSDAAQSELEALGIAAEAAALMLAIADHQLQQQNIKDVFALDKEQYLAGNIDLNTVVTDLAQAGATVQQQNKYYAQLQYAGRSKPKSPTTAEFIKWFKAQLITASDLVAGLQLLGYSNTWIPFYLLEAGVTENAVAEMGYNIGVPTQA